MRRPRSSESIFLRFATWCFSFQVNRSIRVYTRLSPQKNALRVSLSVTAKTRRSLAQRLVQPEHAFIAKLGIDFVLRFAPQGQCLLKDLSALGRHAYSTAARVAARADRHQ